MSKPLKPQIRFKGYDDEWQQAKVREVFNLGNGYTPSKAVSAYWTNGTIPWFRMEDIRENGRVLADAIQHVTPSAVKSSGLFPAGSIIVSTTATIGEHALLIADSLANQQFTVFQTVNRWSWLKANYLLYRFYGLGDWCRRNVNAGGLAAVNISDLQKYDINYPKEETERDYIAEYFSNLDTQIKEAEREVVRLEKMKIASLQKMFPRPGATAPEIRFAYFTGKWEEKRIDELCHIFGRIGFRGYTVADIVPKGQGAISLSPTNLVGTNTIQYDTQTTYISNAKYLESPEIMIFPGDVVFVKTASVGRVAFIDHIICDTTLNPQLVVFKKLKCDGRFMSLALAIPEFQDKVRGIAGGGVLQTMSQVKLGEQTIKLPSFDEQKAIGEYFRNLDELIAAKRKSIVKLRNIKKACLSKMFVNDTEL